MYSYFVYFYKGQGQQYIEFEVSVRETMNPIIANQLIQTINKSAQLIINSFKEVYSLTAEYIRLSAEEEKREKDRNKPPKVYFQKEGPFPDDVHNRETMKKTNDQQTKNDQRKDKHQNTQIKPPTKPPPQYLSYKKQQQPKNSSKTPPKPNLNDSTQSKVISKKSTKLPAREQTVIASSSNLNRRPPINPLRPKPPISAFLRFNKAHIDAVRKQCPQMSQCDLVTVTGHMWNNLDPSVKKKFQQEYAREKQRYDAEMMQFFRKNPTQKKSKKQIQREKQAAALSHMKK